MKIINFITASSMAAALLASCDDGSVTDKTYTDTSDTYSVVIKGKLTGTDTWSKGYNVVLGGFNDESAYSLIQKSISLNGDELDISLSGIPATTKTIEIAAVNSLRIKYASLYSYTIPENQRPYETMTIDMGTVDGSMFNAIQKNIFEKTDMNCFRCHSSAAAAGRLSLVAGESYASLVGVASNHDASVLRVKAGDASNSLLYQSMSGNILSHMDHTGFFAGTDNGRLLALLRSWIDGGAKK